MHKNYLVCLTPSCFDKIILITNVWLVICFDGTTNYLTPCLQSPKISPFIHVWNINNPFVGVLFPSPPQFFGHLIYSIPDFLSLQPHICFLRRRLSGKHFLPARASGVSQNFGILQLASGIGLWSFKKTILISLYTSKTLTTTPSFNFYFIVFILL